MAYTTINKSTDYFNTKLYTGNGSAGNALTGIGHQPDLVWMKGRNQAFDQCWYDAVRGVTKLIRSNLTNAEATQSGVTAFGSDGFTLGSSGETNSNNDTYVAWNWKANGAGSSNTDGSITSTVSASTTSGFSIVKWTGTGSAATVGHGLGTTPGLIIIKNYSRAGEDWVVWHDSFAANQFIRLNTTAAVATSTSMWNNTLPTSTVFSLVNEEKNNYSGDNIIGYCFAEKTGFSKFGSYTGTSDADGPFLYCGFKPAFYLWKPYNATDSWNLVDSKRDGYNPDNNRLFPNASSAEDTQDRVDLVSNGIKIRTSDGGTNSSSRSYIFMAFAEEPLVSSNGVPATAR